ncbi:T9SS type B sorting domain-containing protein [Thalassobellus citreus]|uniref:T9SS type B sorting domain-containing protein n=1 Tax=Thalassobellus citreus TaxID=3367752 RepID=UPI0037A65302
MYNKSEFTIFYIVFFLLINSFCWSQNIAPTLTATGDQLYCPKTQINIVTDFNIDDPDDTEIAALYVQISTGYVQGEDSLSLAGAHPNITTSWNSSEGKLTLTGLASATVSYVDLIAAVKNVVFQSTSNSPNNKTFSITIGDANYLPKTDHYYEYVSDYGITWSAARTAAENRTYFGLKGYLVTITSAEEAQLTGEQAAGAGWIGGTDEETEGVWKWVTGPESGTIFWNGKVTGSTLNYANWNHNEPNDANGGEDYAHITDPSIGIKGAWNDLRVGGDPPGLYHPKGYIVEYGGIPGDPVLNISAFTKVTAINTSIVSTKSNSICGSGSITIEATVSQGDVLWFDSPSGGTSIATGSVYITPTLNATTTYYVSASFNGCINDERIPVVASVYQIPVIQPSITFKNCDVDGNPDGYTDFNLNEANDIITNNSSAGLDISYYTDFNEAYNGTSNTIDTSIPFNNVTSNIIFARVENNDGCYAISEVTLEVSTTSLPSNFSEILSYCDEDNDIDGFYEFDLTEATQTFLDKLPLGENLSIHYFENLNDAQLEQNEILGVYENKDAFLQTLYVRVESDDNGDCFGIGAHLQLAVHPKPEFEVGQSKVLCSDGDDVTLFTSNPNYTYEWKDSAGVVVGNLPELTIDSGGSYEVVATSNFSCKSFPIVYNVEESSIARIESNDIEIIELTDNNSIKINNKNNNLGIGDYEFALDNIGGPYQDESFFENVLAGSHIVYIQDKNGCGIEYIEVFILGFPKFFTPNNDGVNDTWQIKGLGTDYTNASKVKIYNRYGKLIKQLTSKNGAWDGTFNGQLLPDSDYWFLAELVELTGEIRIYRGHFSLVR